MRAALVRKQQAIVADGDWVAEGRDIGTVVAPDAAVKVFLHRRPGERARRRARRPRPQPSRRSSPRQRERDVRDSTADRSTLEAPNGRRSPVDTTGLTLDEVVDQVVTLAIEAKEIEA